MQSSEVVSSWISTARAWRGILDAATVKNLSSPDSSQDPSGKRRSEWTPQAILEVMAGHEDALPALASAIPRLSDVDPLLEWLVVRSTTSSSPSSSSTTTASTSVSNVKDTPDLDGSLLLAPLQLRSMLKLLGVKPQNAQSASYAVCNALALASCILDGPQYPGVEKAKIESEREGSFVDRPLLYLRRRCEATSCSRDTDDVPIGSLADLVKLTTSSSELDARRGAGCCFVCVTSETLTKTVMEWLRREKTWIVQWSGAGRITAVDEQQQQQQRQQHVRTRAGRARNVAAAAESTPIGSEQNKSLSAVLRSFPPMAVTAHSQLSAPSGTGVTATVELPLGQGNDAAIGAPIVLAPTGALSAAPFPVVDVGDRVLRSRLWFAMSLHKREASLVVLVGGTSGCGKSTLAQLLANRLGIETVISTDSVRERLRASVDPAEVPELFVSSYEAHTAAVSSRHSDPGASGDTADSASGSASSPSVVSSFRRQAECVLAVVDRLLDSYIQQGTSVLVEGVHLLPDYCARKARTVTSAVSVSPTSEGQRRTGAVLCIPLLVHIVNPDKHLLRFAIRSKSMTLKPGENRYVGHFSAIRLIQQHLAAEARRCSMVLVNNTNVDKSLSSVHRLVLNAMDEAFDCTAGTVSGQRTALPGAAVSSAVPLKSKAVLLAARGASSIVTAPSLHPGDLFFDSSAVRTCNSAILLGDELSSLAVVDVSVSDSRSLDGLAVHVPVKGKELGALLRKRRQDKEHCRARSADNPPTVTSGTVASARAGGVTNSGTACAAGPADWNGDRAAVVCSKALDASSSHAPRERENAPPVARVLRGLPAFVDSCDRRKGGMHVEGPPGARQSPPAMLVTGRHARAASADVRPLRTHVNASVIAGSDGESHSRGGCDGIAEQAEEDDYDDDDGAVVREGESTACAETFVQGVGLTWCSPGSSGSAREGALKHPFRRVSACSSDSGTLPDRGVDHETRLRHELEDDHRSSRHSHNYTDDEEYDSLMGS